MFDEGMSIGMRCEAGSGFTGPHVLWLLLSDAAGISGPIMALEFPSQECLPFVECLLHSRPCSVKSDTFICFSPHHNHLQQLTLCLFYILDEFQSNFQSLSEVTELRSDEVRCQHRCPDSRAFRFPLYKLHPGLSELAGCREYKCGGCQIPRAWHEKTCSHRCSRARLAALESAGTEMQS